MIIKDDQAQPIAIDTKWANIDAQNISTETAYMVVDLSDTTNWKHVKTNAVELRHVSVNINPSSAYRGDIYLGFLSGVTATNGDMNIIKVWHVDQAGLEVTSQLNFSHNKLVCTTGKIFGAIDANNVAFQSDVNLVGPDGGAAAYPSGDGDLVMKVTRTAGNVDVNLLVGYTTS